MGENGIEYIVYGPREAVQAEYGTLDCYEGKFLVQPIGEFDYDAEGFDTLKLAYEHSKYLAEETGVTKISRVGAVPDLRRRNGLWPVSGLS